MKGEAIFRTSFDCNVHTEDWLKIDMILAHKKIFIKEYMYVR